MAVESKRGCGYRKVGGMYLVGGVISAPCDRLPYPLNVCPVCNQGIKVGRAFTEKIPYDLFGIHKNCQDSIIPCPMCHPHKNRTGIIMNWIKLLRYIFDRSYRVQRRAIKIRRRILNND